MIASAPDSHSPVLGSAPPVEKEKAVIEARNSSFKNMAPFTKTIINRSAALYVPAGTSLLAVATKYKVKLSRLLEWNDLKKDGILEKDQFIFLEKKQNAAEIDFCFAQEGESLHDISQKYGVWIKNILEYNSLSSSSALTPGTRIYLKPGVATVQGKSNEPRGDLSGAIYNAVPKDGLFSETQNVTWAR